MDWTALLLIATCVAALAIAFFCSLTEAVLLSLNPLSLRLGKTGGESTSARWLALKNRIERPISAILVFSTLASTGLATLAGALFSDLAGAEWLWIFSLVISAAVLLVGEMMPKVLGVHHAERLAPRLLVPLTWMLWLCHPFVVVLEKVGERLRPRSSSPHSGSDAIMDIITLVQSARAEQVLHNREEIIIIHAATLSARRVKSVMVPRDAVRVFNRSLSLQENVSSLGPKLHRSYPVDGSGSLDEVGGYVRVRELFVQNLSGPAAAWNDLIRPVLRVRHDATLTHLLALFLERDEIAALVEDAMGRATGWITLDDVTETLMGARN